ncbi:Fusaric acid resistance protein-like-domain-containing protein [Lipomyces japonicus]|uniref:Fusaric acid resistance protein-like-domain-containing protein n=1 Tax=Lipomyces japonicus TaxID=56871 RepID=UPI0034CF38C6
MENLIEVESQSATGAKATGPAFAGSSSTTSKRHEEIEMDGRSRDQHQVQQSEDGTSKNSKLINRSEHNFSPRPYSLLRNYSLIIPETGERVRRQITLDSFPASGTERAISSGRQQLIDEEGEIEQELDEATALLLEDPVAAGQRISTTSGLQRLNIVVKRWAAQRSWSVQWARWLYKKIVVEEYSKPLKCSLTYFLASLTVYSAMLSPLFGTSDGKHLAATVTVYFYPSRSIGSMLEAIMFAEISLLYSAILSFLSMEVVNLFSRLSLIELGYAIVLFVFCAGGLGSIALMKHKVGKPSFNTACSLASTSFATILIREGAIQAGQVSFAQIRRVMFTVHFGVAIAVSVCFLIFPYTAIGKLKQTSNNIMDTYSLILATLTRSFLAGTNVTASEIENLFRNARSLFTKLDTYLGEAKFEHYIKGTEAEFFIHARLVKSIQSLTQHLGGLHSSLAMEWHLTTTQIGHSRSQCAQIFDIFVYYLGPPMKSLTFTIKRILESIPFDDETMEVYVNENYEQSLNMALEMYNIARTKALREIYSLDVFANRTIGEGHDDLAIILEEVASTCGQFSHGLADLSKEVQGILEIMKDYKQYVGQGRQRSWWWIVFWKDNPQNYKKVVTMEDRVTVPQTFSHLFSDDESEIKQNENISAKERFSLRVWRSLRVFRRNDVKYGIKVGIGALLFTLPAFFEKTRPIYSHYRAEWGLVAFVIMMNMSIGGTTSTVAYRLCGTAIGCLSAYVAWQLFPSNKAMLSLCGLLIAFPCFVVILRWKKNNSFGRFILLSFNLTALYSYSLSQNDFDDDRNEDEGGANPYVGEIAIHRLIAVSCGVLWGLFITFYVWPNSARSNLKRKLSILLIRMGLIWKNDPLSSLAHHGESLQPYISIQDEQTLQRSLLKMGHLVSAADDEYRLKGPFNTKEYKKIMETTQDILDAYHNINSLITKDLFASEGEARIIASTSEERKELSNRIFLLFYLIASALRLGLPLPNHLPNTQHARDRMIVKINQYRMREYDANAVSDDDFVLFYAYILATLSINEGLLQIIASIQEIYGAIEEEALTI